MSLIINSCLIRLKVHLAGGKSCLVLETQAFSCTSEVIILTKIYDCHFAKPAQSPYYILNLILILRVKCVYHPSSQKLLFTANGDHDNKPQLDIMQKSRVCEGLSPKTYVYTTVRESGSEIITEKGVEKWKESEYQEIWHKAIASRNDFIKKTGTVALSIIINEIIIIITIILLFHGVPPLVKDLHATNDCWERTN